MNIEIQLFDEHVDTLLKSLNKEARKYDAAKYGLPLKENVFRSIVYAWLLTCKKEKKKNTVDDQTRLIREIHAALIRAGKNTMAGYCGRFAECIDEMAIEIRQLLNEIKQLKRIEN